MTPVLAQSTEIVDAAKGLSNQAPVLALGFLAFSIVVWIFLKWIKEQAA
jgi:hypothetical protein